MRSRFYGVVILAVALLGALPTAYAAAQPRPPMTTARAKAIIHGHRQEVNSAVKRCKRLGRFTVQCKELVRLNVLGTRAWFYCVDRMIQWTYQTQFIERGCGKEHLDSTGPGHASALPGHPFEAEDQALYELATAYWGGPPAGCKSVARRIVPEGKLASSDELGEATLPRSDQKSSCRLLISAAAQADRREECIVMLHEVGHLHGMHHSADPANIMFPSPTEAPFPACEVSES